MRAIGRCVGASDLGSVLIGARQCLHRPRMLHGKRCTTTNSKSRTSTTPSPKKAGTRASSARSDRGVRDCHAGLLMQLVRPEVYFPDSATTSCCLASERCTRRRIWVWWRCGGWRCHKLWPVGYVRCGLPGGSRIHEIRPVSEAHATWSCAGNSTVSTAGRAANGGRDSVGAGRIDCV